VVLSVAVGRLRLVISPAIRAEYIAKASGRSVLRLFASRGVEPDRYLSLVQAICDSAELVEPTGTAPPCRDEKDRKYLHCAVEAAVDYLVTADDDMLSLQHVDGTPIVDPPHLLAELRSAGVDVDT
jgi:putative PIN family toxin of toxin-antitoxin system